MLLTWLVEKKRVRVTGGWGETRKIWRGKSGGLGEWDVEGLLNVNNLPITGGNAGAACELPVNNHSMLCREGKYAHKM
jgi:hypothetical protein